MKLYTIDPRKGKKILAGEYIEKAKTFIKSVDNDHYMIKEKGYGIQADIMQTLNKKDCIIIKVQTKLTEYKVSFKAWFEQPIKDYGNGPQKFYAVANMFTKDACGQLTLD
jgi:hypothetical protein